MFLSSAEDTSVLLNIGEMIDLAIGTPEVLNFIIVHINSAYGLDLFYLSPTLIVESSCTVTTNNLFVNFLDCN